MAANERARVAWVYRREDETYARELARLSAVLELQGSIKNLGLFELRANQTPTGSLVELLRSADVVMVLVSPDLLGSEWALREIDLAQRSLSVRVIPVLLRPVSAIPTEFGANQVLPRDGTAIAARRDRDEGLLEVLRGLQETVTFRRRKGKGQAPVQAPTLSRLTINDIFRLDGPPTVTFVPPSRFAELKLELVTMGTGLIVEGPSKVGKSTAVKRGLGDLHVTSEQQTWWLGHQLPPLNEFERALDDLLAAKERRWVFIDDFHYVEDERYRRALAFRMKALADQDRRSAKVTLIGINPLGASLAQAMPDLAGRFRVMRIDRDPAQSTKIAELILQGERAANIRFTRREEFIVAAGGSFFIAQLLCNRAAVQAGVLEPAGREVLISLGLRDVVAGIRDELAARFRNPLLEFAAFDEKPPPRGAGLSLLWLLARSAEDFIALKEARLRFPRLSPVFDWFLASNLSRCFQAHPSLKGLLYFNRATATLTMEDPQLRFYLRELDWPSFAGASGHGAVSFHPEDGPLWPVTGNAVAAVEPARADARGAVGEVERRVLHLSDLHFSSADQALTAYAQLAADLRQQGCEKLDALLVSGDVTNRALPAELEAARLFLEKVMNGFSLAVRAVVVVPGNHDVNWELSRSAYPLKYRSDYPGPLAPGSFIEFSPEVIAVREEEAYRRRFEPFAAFFRSLTGEEYPLAPDEQAVVADLPGAGLCVLGLNSAWEIDHHYRDRASIETRSLARALVQLGPPEQDPRLRVALFHHPLQSDEDSRIRDTSFLQQLAVNGFVLVLHGHVHKSDAAVYRYDRSVGGRTIQIITAGTFGAPTCEWRAGYPLQYNLLRVGGERIIVETRCRREENGAWEPDARWLQGHGKDPLPRYTIDLAGVPSRARVDRVRPPGE